MAIKGGDLIHVGNSVLIDRAQTAGPGTLNINQEKIYELGNYYSVGTDYDDPDLTFGCESFDVSAEFEAMLLGSRTAGDDPAAPAAGSFEAAADGAEYKLAASKPMDVVSQFKPGLGAAAPYNVIGSIAVPYLVLESASYRFGAADRATQNFSLRGDAMFFNPGGGIIEEFAGPFAAGGDITLTHPANLYRGDTVAGARYALSVTIAETGRRLRANVDYTEDATGTGPGYAVTLTLADAVPAGQRVRVVYSTTDTVSYPQLSHAVTSGTRPASLRGRDIEFRVGGDLAASDRWSGVQNVTVDYRVNLDRDRELGNSQVVSIDFEVPEVSGTVEIRPRDYAELYQRVRQTAGVVDGEVAGATTTFALPLAIMLHSPVPLGTAPFDGAATHNVLKTLYIPDARFTLPGVEGRVQQKTNVTLNWSSDTGALSVHKGLKPELA